VQLFFDLALSVNPPNGGDNQREGSKFMKTIVMDLSSKEDLLLEIQKNTINFKQEDINQRFCIALYDESQEWCIPDDAVLSVWYSGPSGEGSYSEVEGNSAFIVSGNQITITPAPEMIAAPGSGLLCLSIHAPASVSRILWNLVYTVEGTPAVGNPQMGTYFTALSGLVRQAQSAANTFQADPTLSIAGKAADAAATGAALDKITSEFAGFKTMTVTSTQAETPQVMLERIWNQIPEECNIVILHNNSGVVGTIFGNKATEKYATFLWFNYASSSVYLLKRLNNVWEETAIS
jgi:hypothetical protein